MQGAASAATQLYELRIMSLPLGHIYDQDKLRTLHNHEFMDDPQFVKAYGRGIQAVGSDYNWHWRVHVGLWAAKAASHLPGDYVECGVNKGFMSSAIMELLDWDRTGRRFFLLDTFAGLDPRYISAEEEAAGILAANEKKLKAEWYVSSADSVIANFAEWKNKKIIVGSIPDTLPEIDSKQIAFVHIDLNCRPPEIAAMEYLWPYLVPGAFILMDDYAYDGYRQQKLGMDEFAAERGVQVLSLPTGQGLMVKPPMGATIEAAKPAAGGFGLMKWLRG